MQPGMSRGGRRKPISKIQHLSQLRVRAACIVEGPSFLASKSRSGSSRPRDEQERCFAWGDEVLVEPLGLGPVFPCVPVLEPGMVKRMASVVEDGLLQPRAQPSPRRSSSPPWRIPPMRRSDSPIHQCGKEGRSPLASVCVCLAALCPLSQFSPLHQVFSTWAFCLPFAHYH